MANGFRSAPQAMEYAKIMQRFYIECSAAAQLADSKVETLESQFDDAHRVVAEMEADHERILQQMRSADRLSTVVDGETGNRQGWLYVYTPRLGGLGAGWVKHWCTYNAASKEFEYALNDKAVSALGEARMATSERFHHVFSIAGPRKDSQPDYRASV